MAILRLKAHIMARKHYAPEQLIAKLREAEVRLTAGEKTKSVCRSLGIASSPTTDGDASMAA